MMEEDLLRMFIDLTPPDRPERGDCWIRMGEWRTWNGDDWDPPWLPPLPTRNKPRRPRMRKGKIMAAGDE